MGYTHYHTTKETIGDTEWDKFSNDASKILSQIKEIDLSWEKHNDAISFNGVDEGEFETYIIKRHEEEFEFCKTAQRPYDDVVQAISLLAKIHFRDKIKISCDGGAEAYPAGIVILKEFGFLNHEKNYTVINPLDKWDGNKDEYDSIKDDGYDLFDENGKSVSI